MPRQPMQTEQTARVEVAELSSDTIAIQARLQELDEYAARLTEDGNECHRRAQKAEREAARLRESLS